MLYCNTCLNQVADGNEFCTSCGAPMNATVQPEQRTQPVRPVQPAQFQTETYKEEPISTMGFFGIMFLMMIPVLNFLLLIIWACGGCQKRSKRNFARATILWSLIGIIISVLIILVGGLIFGQGFNTFKDSLPYF